jgi:hypothetical protein
VSGDFIEFSVRSKWNSKKRRYLRLRRIPEKHGKSAVFCTGLAIFMLMQTH